MDERDSLSAPRRNTARPRTARLVRNRSLLPHRRGSDAARARARARRPGDRRIRSHSRRPDDRHEGEARDRREPRADGADADAGHHQAEERRAGRLRRPWPVRSLPARRPDRHMASEMPLEELARETGGQALLIARRVGGAGVSPRAFGIRWSSRPCGAIAGRSDMCWRRRCSFRSSV